MLTSAAWIRVAKPASRGWNVAKTLLQTAVMWGTALWVIPQLILAAERTMGIIPGFPSWRGIGWTLFALASSLGLWSGWTMAWLGDGTPLPLDTARRMVINGPYAWIRNPMAVAGIAQGLSVGLILGSFLVLLYALAGAILWQWIARPVEEADLEARFGGSYTRYRDAVPCWRPRWPGYRGKPADS